MKRISTIYNLVLDILKEDVEARNNDNYLYFSVCKAIAVDNGLDLSKVTVPEFFLHIASKQYPSFETVSRTRRKAQEQYPFLVADDIIENFRKEQEKAFREFARG